MLRSCRYNFFALASWSRSSRATFTRSRSYSTSLCHANSHDSRRLSEEMQGTDCVREEVEAFYKACDLPDVPDDVDEFDDKGFEDDEFYE